MIAEVEDALFERWTSSSSDMDKIVRDGAVDERAYTQSCPKVLFLLKEANDDGGGGWDLREFMRNDPRTATWKWITQWTKVMRKLPNLPTDEELENAWTDPPQRKRLLKSIVVMNLKKVPGSGGQRGADS